VSVDRGAIAERAALLARIEDLYREVVRVLAGDHDGLVPSGSPELVDLGYLARRAERTLKAAGVAAGALALAAGKVLYSRHAGEAAMDPVRKLRVDGELAYAYPDSDVKPAIPRLGSMDHEDLLVRLGVPPRVARTGLLTFHFRNLGTYCTRLAERGEAPPLPTFSDYSCTYRGRSSKEKAADDFDRPIEEPVEDGGDAR
jgi:hypothetical protein